MANRTIINNTAPDADTRAQDNSANVAWAIAIIVVVAFLFVALLYFARINSNVLPGVPNTATDSNVPNTETNVVVPLPTTDTNPGTTTN